MASTEDIVTWSKAVDAYAEGKIDEAKAGFQALSCYAKPLFNLGQVHLFENDAADAYAVFTMALTLDPCLALAFYQRGYAACLEQRYQEALEDYSQALELLRDNDSIDYSQLGLPYTLHRAELFHNRAMCHYFMADQSAAALDLAMAQKVLKVSPARGGEVIETAARMGISKDHAVLFSVPFNVVFGIGEAKRKNMGRTLESKKAHIVGPNEGMNAFHGFEGERLVNASRSDTSTLSVTHPKPPLPSSSIKIGRSATFAGAPVGAFPEAPRKTTRSGSLSSAFGRTPPGSPSIYARNPPGSPSVYGRTPPVPSPKLSYASPPSQDVNDTINRVADYLNKTFTLDDPSTPILRAHGSPGIPSPIYPGTPPNSLAGSPATATLTPPARGLPIRSASLNQADKSPTPYRKNMNESLTSFEGVESPQKIKLRIHTESNDTLRLLISMPLPSLLSLERRIKNKLGLEEMPGLAYRDTGYGEEGEEDMITMVEDEDLQMAVDGKDVCDLWVLGGR